jgi:surfeit locus 1 family protein
MTSEAPGRPVLLTILVLIALAILIGLGTWQLKRLAWKRDLLARIERLQTAPPRPVGEVLAAAAAGRDVGFARVTVDCPGLARAPYLELHAITGGQAGSRLISACRLTGGPFGAVLVDRGFVADTISARPPADPADRTPLTLTGVLRAPDPKSFVAPADTPGRWFTRDIPAMAAALGAPRPAPLFLMAETATNPEWLALKPQPLPADLPNRHLEYELTWFGLAAALLGVYAALLWRRRSL